MKLQHIAAAVALVAAGAANAAIATGGNGSLVLIAYDNIGGTTTAGVFDLGLTMNDLVGATGNGSGFAAGSLAGSADTKIVWDFAANSLTINGQASTFGNNSWTAAWNRLLANSDAGELRFVVTAFDTVGIAQNFRTLVTGVENPTAAQLDNDTTQSVGLAQVAGGRANDIFAPIANKGTVGSADNGAYTFIAADGDATRANGYALAGDAFASEWRGFNKLNGETYAGDKTWLWLVDGRANETRSAGFLNLDVANGQLVLSAVPEPSTYALMVSGLIAVGALARRRRA